MCRRRSLSLLKPGNTDPRVRREMKKDTACIKKTKDGRNISRVRKLSFFITLPITPEKKAKQVFKSGFYGVS